MGTTIRREPVNFAIPAAPDYKFLNITNFRGLDVSSNPFELATNTASDCLNVYVDETNTLTTRPRLEKKVTTPGSGEHIGTYNLHNGYLLHYLQDGKGVMHKLINGTKTEVGGIIPIIKCKYFEQGDKIYLLDGNRYMVVSDNVLSDVEGYVPTTSIVALDGSIKNVDSSNLLSNKYIKKYHWDGVTTQHLPTDTFDLENPNYKQKNLLTNSAIRVYNDNSAISQDGYSFYYIEDCTETTDETLICTLTTTSLSNVAYYASKTASNKMFCFIDTVNEKVHIYTKTNTEWSHDNRPSPLTSSAQINGYGGGFGGNEDASILWVETPTKTIVYKWTGTEYTEVYSSIDSMQIRCVAVSVTNEIALLVKDSNNNYMLYHAASITSTPTKVTDSVFNSPTVPQLGLSNNSEVLWILDTYKNITMFFKTNGVFSDTNKRVVTLAYDVSINSLSFDDTTKTSWFADGNARRIYQTGNYMTDNYVFIGVTGKSITALYPKQTLVVAGTQVLVWDNTIDNFITSTSTIRDDADWLTKRETFFKSLLMTRFDNNYWFASKNRYYRSANNDPTYFPITEYNDLGDINEEITGFNLANDTTLIAYKKNRVYLIQPFTSSLDTTEYTITESKNTVGNTAIGAPIVTTLTEIPLQINNDGVYGLSQLSNVSSTERIADLMSEPINERWLNIDDQLISNTQTLNRLYWTYIILPDKTHNKTMIYLLDNRSNSWYYWELPIIVSDSFIKDNKVEFVDIIGNIYYLTTTDIIDINYDDEKVTKYYDEGGRLIPWFWQSQVLPMGTMNYSKRLVNTTFILTDTDDSDGYGLQYNFKVFRKLASSTPEKEISDKLTLVRSTTKKTNISKFGFLQMRISNLTKESRDYEAYENNKLRLVGLGLKYVLLEGLIR